MPRKARLNVPGTVCHVMARCLRSESLFRDDDDRSFFLRLFSSSLSQTGYRCYAWVLMNNHYHFVVRTSSLELWHLMKPLNTHYAAYHKKRYGRMGPLFLDRYKSIVTQDQNYVQELVRYVHLNPIRAGICKDLNTLAVYPWSGHGALMGRFCHTFQDTQTVINRFGESVEQSRERYRAYLKEGIERDLSEDVLVRLVRNSNAGVESGRSVGCWIIGDQSFIKNAIAQSDLERLRISRFEHEGKSLDRLAEKVAMHMGVGKARIRIRSRGGKESEARKVFVFAAVKEYHAPSRVVAEYCGVGQAAISALAKAGREIALKRELVF
jgi:putative transposase